MAVSTVTGSGTLTTLLVSTGTNLIIPENQTTSLLQSVSAMVTGVGHTVLILGRVASTHDSSCQLDLTIDGTLLLEGSAGDQIIARTVLAPGSHTVEFTAFGLDNDITAEVFGLTIIDLGL